MENNTGGFKRNLILALCLFFIGVIVALLFRPAPKPQIIGTLTKEQESELRATVATLEVQNDSLWTALEQSKADGKVAETSFKKEIGGHKKEIARLKENPVVIQLVQETPALDSLHKAYDSAMVSYEGRIVGLTDELHQRDKINSELMANFEQRLSNTEQLLADKEAENQQQANEIKKLRRKLVLTKIVGVIIIGGIVALSL